MGLTGAEYKIVPLHLRKCDRQDLLDAFSILSSNPDLTIGMSAGLCADIFADKLENQDVFAIVEKSVVGLVGYISNHFHIFALPEFRGKCGRIIKQMMTYGIEHHGIIETKIHQSNGYVLRVAGKFGFKKIGQIDGYYLLEKVGQ